MADNKPAPALKQDEVRQTKAAISKVFHGVLKARNMCECNGDDNCEGFATHADKALFKSIRQVVEECLTELSPDFTYKKKKINNRIYWYAVWWDRATKRKMEKYVSAGAQKPTDTRGRQVVIEEKLRRQVA